MELPELNERLSALELRLEQLEKQDHPVSWKVQASSPELKWTPPKQFGKTPRPGAPGNWLGYIAVLCFILAALFIIKLSVETGWLTPERQIGIAFLFGAGLIGCGLKVLPLDKEYGSLLPAAGIIVLYLSTFAAHRLYFLWSFQTALVVSTLVSAVCIGLYLRIRHDVYSIAASIGTYLAPVALNVGGNATFSLYYFLICSCTFATISLWVESRTLTVISAYLAILISGIVGLSMGQEMFLAIMLSLHFFVFAIGIYFYSGQLRQPMTEYEAWSLLPVLVIFYAMEYFYISRALPGWAPWVSIGFACILIALYLSTKKYHPDKVIGSQSLIMTFSTLVFFHSIYLDLLPDDIRPWLFPIIVSVWAFLPKNTFRRPDSLSSWVPLLSIFLILAIELGTMIIHLFQDEDASLWLVVSSCALLSIWLAILAKRKDIETREEFGLMVLLTAHGLAIMILYQLFSNLLAVSASWLFYAVCVISFAFYKKDKIMAKSALLVLSVAAGKALLYDAASAPTIVRSACLLLTGVVLYACGFVIKKIATWTS